MSVKDYKIGDNIIECKPFVHTLREEKKKIICDHCFGRISRDEIKVGYDCNECNQMFYCCFECKSYDKRFHQKECLIFEKYYFPYLKNHFQRLILRTYLMAIDDKDILKEEFDLYDGNKRSFDGLIRHSTQIMSDTNRFNHYEYIYENIYYFAKEFCFELNYQFLYDLFCRLVINHFDVITYDETRPETIGSGLYISAAVINHSCEPNAATIYFGNTLVLKAIKQIKTGDEITISYVDLEMDRFHRQSWLKSWFYFDCQCIKCQSNDFEINFKTLDQLKTELRRESKTVSPDWLIVSRLSDKMIDICHQIYGRFHPQLIPVLIDILSAKYQNKWKDSHELNEFVSQLRQSLELIYGTNHMIYKTFVKCVQKKVFYRL